LKEGEDEKVKLVKHQKLHFKRRLKESSHFINFTASSFIVAFQEKIESNMLSYEEEKKLEEVAFQEKIESWELKPQ